jgi:hypothetical protein
VTDYYKVARANGWDGRTGNTVNYRTNIGQTVAPPNPRIEPNHVCRSGILHAFGSLECAIRRSAELVAKGYGCSFYRVQGTPVCSDSNYPEHNPNATYGFLSLYIVEEIEL